MEFNFRTDLAIETQEAYHKAKNKDIPGVRVIKDERDGVRITEVKVETEEAAREISKAIGSYTTLEIPKLDEEDAEEDDKVYKVFARELRKMIGNNRNEAVLVVGLGNSNVTPDALGPKVVSFLEVTRHIIEFAPEYLTKPVRSVSAISPGVLGTTGIETSEIIKGVVERVKPDLIIAIDALASRKLERISTTIQIADTGINPGSGVGNKRVPLSKETLGIPVVAIGVPTVVDAATMANDTIELMLENMNDKEKEEVYGDIKGIKQEAKYDMIKKVLNPYVGDLVVTPKEIDSIIGGVSKVVAHGINYALHSEEAE